MGYDWSDADIEVRMCECEGEHELFIWRSDPNWWSCGCCDRRVRPIRSDELDARAKSRSESS